MARPANLDRPVGKPKPASKIDNRPDKLSPLGDVTRGRDAMAQSKRGNKSMGGGVSHPDFKRPSGGGGGNAQKFKAPKHKMSGGGGNMKRKRRH
jgi:hypothetical protein